MKLDPLQKYDVDKRKVREWRSKKSELEEYSSKKKQLPGGGRKPILDVDLEEELSEWINSSRA